MSTDLQTTEKQTAVVPANPDASSMELALAGDLSKLTQPERLKFYGAVCEFTGLNPLTKPFDWLTFQGKLVLYPNKGCAEQLRKIHGVSLTITARSLEHGCMVVHCRAVDKHGRTDEAIGAVAFNENVKGEAAAIALMKSETKAKRRVTLSICGLGLLDDIDPHERKEQSAAVSEIETAQDLAANFNKSLTAGEKETSIDAEVVPEPPKESTAATPVAPVSQPAKVAPADVKAPASDEAAAVSSAPPEELPFEEPAPQPENDTQARLKVADELELIFSENKDCIGYCVFKGMLPKGKGLSEIDQVYAGKILKNPKGFIRTVEGWVKGGRK